MRNYVYIATSLDGFIARRDGSLDWLTKFANPGQEDYGYVAFMENMDAVVMGRKTYEFVKSMGAWPYTKPVVVLSRTLPPSEQPNLIEVVANEPPMVVEKLTQRGFRHLYIDGGQTIQRFLNYNLIDELIITRVPLLLGAGIPLFGHLHRELPLQHLKTIAFKNGLVQSHYQVMK